MHLIMMKNKRKVSRKNLSLFNANAQTVDLQLPAIVTKSGVTFQSPCIYTAAAK